MTAPDWLNDSVRRFGRHLNLATFALNGRGAAGVRFEDGREFRLGYASGALGLTVTRALPRDGEAARAVLAAAHPEARHDGTRVCSGYVARSGRAFFHTRIPEREVTPDAIMKAFAALWAVSGGTGRSAWA